MIDHYTCEECGESVDPKGTPHQCPGSDSDRIYDLERRVAELEEFVAELIKAVEGTVT